MSLNGARLPAPNDWTVEMMRLTAFPLSPPHHSISAELRESWNRLFPSLAPAKIEEDVQSSTTRILGQVGRHRVLLTGNPISRECRYLGDPGTSLQYDAAARFFSDTLATPWLESAAVLPIRRLAFGAELHLPVESGADGRRVLDMMLPAVDVGEAIDLHFQANWRRESQVLPGILLNRISQWSEQTLETLTVNLRAPKAPTTRTAENICHLRLDINTVPRKEPMNPADQAGLFTELMQLGREIVEKGATP